MINMSLSIYLDTLLYIDNAHDDVIKWEHFPRYWPFLRGIHRWILLTKVNNETLVICDAVALIMTSM